MLQVAVVSEGGKTTLLPFEITQDGHFLIPGASGPRFAAQNPRIPHLTIGNLGPLLDAFVPVKMRRRPGLRAVLRVKARAKALGSMAASQNIQLRFFQTIKGGLYEVPAALVMTSWARFLDEVDSRFVSYPAGQAMPSFASAVTARAELKTVGFSAEESDAVLRFVSLTAEAAKAEKFTEPQVLAQLRAAAESPLVIAAAIVFGLIFGVDVAVNSPIGEWWEGGQSRLALMLLAFGALGFAIWRSGK